MKQIVIWIALLLLIIPYVPANAAAIAPETERKLEQYIKGKMEQEHIPGLAVAIVSRDGSAYTRGFGYANLADKTPVTPDTMFELGSTSKAFTALAVLQLRDRNLLRLQAKVEEYLPWLQVEYQNQPVSITVEQLLRHESGIPENTIVAIPESRADDALEQTVRGINGIHLTQPPGKKFEYATINYDILGLIVQNLAGVSFERYMEQSVFAPLGLTHTVLDMPEQLKPLMAVGYKPAFGGNYPYDAPVYRGNRPAGYVISNANDLSKWLSLHLKHTSVPEMTAYLAETHPAVSGNYGMGWYSKGSVVFHAGANPNYASYVIFQPQSRMGVAVLANVNTTKVNDIGAGLLSLLQGGNPQQAPSDLDLMRTLDKGSSVAFYSAVPCLLLFGWLMIRSARMAARKQLVRHRLQWYHAVLLLLNTAFLAAIWLGLYLIPYLLRGVPWGYAIIWGPYSLPVAVVTLAVTVLALYVFLSIRLITVPAASAAPNAGIGMSAGNAAQPAPAAFRAKSGVRSYSTLAVLVRLLREGKPHLLWYIALMAITAASSPLWVFLTDAYRQMTNAAVDKNAGLLTDAMIAASAVVAGQFILGIIRSQINGRLDTRSTLHLQSKVMRHMLRLPLQSAQQLHTADLVTRIQQSASSAQTGLNNRVVQMLGNVLQAGSMLIYLSILNVNLVIGSLVIAFLMPGLLTPLSKTLRKIHDRRQSESAKWNAFVQDAVQGAEIVRTFNLPSYFYKLYETKYDQILRLSRKALWFESFLQRANLLVFIGGLLFVLGYGGLLVIRGALDIGALVAFLVSFNRITRPIMALSTLWTQLQESIAHANRVFEILDMPQETAMSSTLPESIASASTEGINVRFDSVRFQYDNQPELLKGVSFDALPGQVTALVGASGCGKSTLLKILLRFIEPASGAVWCNGVPLSEMPPDEWRRHIAYVSQEPHLFAGTIRDNIVAGRPDASDEQIVAAAEAAAIHEHIMRLPNQYDTAIGERGMSLSGGERQRVAIARAFLRDPRLLLLDEPTSALDNENEKLVQEAIARLMQGRTTLLVTHRLSLLQAADRVVEIQDGTAVIGDGDHPRTGAPVLTDAAPWSERGAG